MEVIFGSCARMKMRIKFLDVTFSMLVPNQCRSFLVWVHLSQGRLLLKTLEESKSFFKLEKVLVTNYYVTSS